MTHKLLVGAALAVTAAPLVRKYSVSRHSRGFSSSESSVSSPSSPPSSSQPAGGPAAALREYAQRVIAWGKWCVGRAGLGWVVLSIYVHARLWGIRG